jgi:acyl carrier protein
MNSSSDNPIHHETNEITRGVIISVLGLDIERSELTDDVDLFNLGMDSLSVVRLVVALEEELGVQVPAEDMSADLFHRLGDLTTFLCTLRAEAVPA